MCLFEHDLTTIEKKFLKSKLLRGNVFSYLIIELFILFSWYRGAYIDWLYQVESKYRWCEENGCIFCSQ